MGVAAIHHRRERDPGIDHPSTKFAHNLPPGYCPDVLKRGKEKQQPEGSQLNQRYEGLESKTHEYKRSMHMAAKVQPLPRTEQPGSEDRVQRPKPLTPFYPYTRHNLVQKLAYQN